MAASDGPPGWDAPSLSMQIYADSPVLICLVASPPAPVRVRKNVVANEESR